MIEQTAKVIQCNADQVLIEVRRQSACGECSVKSGCGTSVLANLFGKKGIRLCLKNTIDVKSGNDVVIGIAEAGLLKISFLVYMLPLIGMIIFALLGAELFTQLQANNKELMTVFSAITGFVVSGILVRRVTATDKFIQACEPVLLRKTSPGT